jgi:glycerophosphoryl diester phosphodiesterase
MRRALAALAAFFLALMLAFCIPVAAPAAAPSCPKVVAHRTAMLDAPENTVPGITKSAALGADAVEIDVQWSSSSFPVLMHDSTVDRTTNGTGAPSSLGLGALMALLAQDYAPWITDPLYTGANAPHVPYGWEFMSATAGADLDLVVDIHAAPSGLGMEKLRIYVSDYFSWGSRTLVMASAANVVSMRGWEPSLRYMVIEYPPAGRTYTGEYLTSIGAVGYTVPWDRISPALVDYLHAYGLLVYTWTSDSVAVDVAANWLAVANAGVDGLITNEPAAAIAALAPLCVTPTTPPTVGG